MNMSTQITTSPKVYIGLDIHKKTWTVSIQTDLIFHKTYSIPSISYDLEQYITNNFHNYEVFLVYEPLAVGNSILFFRNLNRFL